MKLPPDETKNECEMRVSRHGARGFVPHARRVRHGSAKYHNSLNIERRNKKSSYTAHQVPGPPFCAVAVGLRGQSQSRLILADIRASTGPDSKKQGIWMKEKPDRRIPHLLTTWPPSGNMYPKYQIHCRPYGILCSEVLRIGGCRADLHTAPAPWNNENSTIFTRKGCDVEDGAPCHRSQHKGAVLAAPGSLGNKYVVNGPSTLNSARDISPM
ncbi:hypothetical protein B0I35DRAFT_187159 [Stachybotrys elegans]|uniref:Uncharacterized protein n=1 Tax=Stachybotrys elegans TaxID=80388 RepID=A0A8K0SVQ7_9HYPO|nr:hypothetical protein B0I35DRAFT_187159 [Stachybotrys elegans]